jgi:cytochrome d ubiquinol oxidase subunit II
MPYLLLLVSIKNRRQQRAAQSHSNVITSKTMKILLIIALIGTPLVATYTAFVCCTFNGKVKLDEMSY